MGTRRPKTRQPVDPDEGFEREGPEPERRKRPMRVDSAFREQTAPRVRRSLEGLLVARAAESGEGRAVP